MTSPAVPPSLALVPVNDRAQARLRSLSEELLYAWDRTDASVARRWGASTAATFGTSLKRRVRNVAVLVGKFGGATIDESMAAVDAYRKGHLSQHLGDRAIDAAATGVLLTRQARTVARQAAALIRREPREAVPQLLVLVATSIVVSGGPDGNGGAPDLDLMFGIDAHRSLFSHSILMGATLETGFLSLVELVRLLHGNLPAKHDPLWDKLAAQAESIAHAANTGASVGMAYHLLIDGLVQPGAYHGIGVPMPMEAHQAIMTGNAVAEAVDVANKPPAAAPASGVRREPAQSQPEPSRNWHRPPEPDLPAAAPPVEPAKRQPRRRQAAAAPEQPTTARQEQRRAEPFQVNPLVVKLLSVDERRIIERYGASLAALADGSQKPVNEAQERFALVVQGQALPKTQHELVWMKYQGLQQFAPKKTAADGHRKR